jgi:hypothetical protein
MQIVIKGYLDRFHLEYDLHYELVGHKYFSRTTFEHVCDILWDQLGPAQFPSRPESDDGCVSDPTFGVGSTDGATSLATPCVGSRGRNWSTVAPSESASHWQHYPQHEQAADKSLDGVARAAGRRDPPLPCVRNLFGGRHAGLGRLRYM